MQDYFYYMSLRLPDKTTMALLLMILIFAGCSIVYISNVTTVALREQTRDELGYIATIVAQEINGDDVASIRPGDEQTPAYTGISSHLMRFRNNLPQIKYIYIMRREGNDAVFVVDPNTGGTRPPALIGDVYPSPTKEMMAGFTETSVEKDFITDTWGTTLSAYSPIRDSTGAVVGLVGVDIDQEQALARQNLISWTSYLIVFLGILMAVFGVVGVERTRNTMIEDLTDREKRFRTLFESTYDAILIIRDGKYSDCNPGALRLFKGEKMDIIDKTPYDFSPGIQPDGRPSKEKTEEVLKKTLEGTPQVFTWMHRTLEGKEFDAEVSYTRIELDGAIAVQAIIRDITERKRADDALRQSEQKYRILTESSPDAIFIMDTDHRVIYANMLASTLMSEGLRRIIGARENEADKPEGATGASHEITRVFATGQIVKREDRLTGRGGREIWLDSTFMPLYDETGNAYAVLGVSHDITSRKNMETQIESSLKEKEYLLKEIHHRVKNNLQVISSLLSMQARKATDAKVKEVLTESQNRVKSIALVHEKLYQSRSLDRIEYGDYLTKVVMHLFESFNVNPAQISWKVNAKNVDVNIEQAVPCSLILNEMITNSLKYAFPEGRKGEIIISFVLTDGYYTLDYRDDGVGVAPGANLERAGSLGMQLIGGLTRQLDGKLTIDTAAGVHYTIIFPQKQKGE
jgi:PAS domain S-box-containing protein